MLLPVLASGQRHNRGEAKRKKGVAMRQPEVVNDRLLVEIPFYSVRNVSSPEDLDNGRRVLFGHVPATSVLDLPTDENVRDYLLEAPGKKRRRSTQVLRAIRDTLYNEPHNFSVLNGGVTLVARAYEIDEKQKVLRLLKPSIINGSQTQGVLKDFYADMAQQDVELPTIHVTFELIVTEDDDLIAETSIARNFQEDVMTISIAGRLGQLKDLEKALRREYPDLALRTRETHLSDDFVGTEKLIQAITALTPAELWPKRSEADNPNKTYTYSGKTRCLKDYQTVYDKARDKHDPEHEKYKDLYQYYQDIAPQAHALLEKWKKHQGFQRTGLHSIKRDKRGRVVEVPDGFVFPILSALSAFVRRTEDGWRVVEPAAFEDSVIIEEAISAFREIAKHNPQTMGKSRACYSQLYRYTSLYKKLSQ
jgi:predicted ester cyclase